MAGLPSLSIPCGLSEGLPVGLQLIGHSSRRTRSSGAGMRRAGTRLRLRAGAAAMKTFVDPGAAFVPASIDRLRFLEEELGFRREVVGGRPGDPLFGPRDRRPGRARAARRPDPRLARPPRRRKAAAPLRLCTLALAPARRARAVAPRRPPHVRRGLHRRRTRPDAVRGRPDASPPCACARR